MATSLGELSSAELRAACLSSPYAWAIAYRWLRGARLDVPGPWIELYADQAPGLAVMKASQVMVSEWALNRALWVAETRQGGRGNVVYIMPDSGHLGEFTRARVDSAIEDSPYLAARVKEPSASERAQALASLGGPNPRRAKASDNVGLKRIGSGYVYFRGSNSEAGLLSVDADLVVYDEVDRLRGGTLALGEKRLGSSYYARQLYLSTPTYPEVGIHALWLESDRRRWLRRCPGCRLWQELSFPENVTREGRLVCRKCGRELERLGPGAWVAERPSLERAASKGEALRGYHVTRLFSPRADLRSLAETGYRILARDITDESRIQEWWNQDLGLPYAAKGGQLTDEELAACREDYSLDSEGRALGWKKAAGSRTFLGCDVGAKLHVRIDEYPLEGAPRAVYIGTVAEFGELDELMRWADVDLAVVDAQPEGHSARGFARRFEGRAFLCYYPNTADWPHEEAASWKEGEPVVLAHRTLSLDAAFARIRERRVRLPRELAAQGGPLAEYAAQLKAPVRVREKDSRGLLVSRYVEGGRADHFAHAENYCNIAASRQAREVWIV